jgi:anaerobic magnesium-protoporphyrin IX monomethyl ester cyclase
MKIAFVIPEHLSGRSFLQPPLEMALCSSLLRRDGHEVRLVDNRIENMPLSLLTSKIKGSDLIVIPTTLYDCMQNYWVDFRIQYAIRTINEIKANIPDATVVICGSHGTVRPDLVLRDTLADIVLMGEYEETLQLLAQTMQANKPIHDVPNLVLKRGNEVITTRHDEAFFHPEPNETLLPDYSDIDLDKYYHDGYINNQHVKKVKWGTILAGRGCPYNCLFCYNFFGKNLRLRSPESVVAEMEFMQNTLNVQGIYFIDSVFGVDSGWIFQLCELIKERKLQITWNIESRCDLLNSIDLLKSLKESNCHRIWVGIESFDSNILKNIRKGVTLETIESFLENAKSVGLEVGSFINFGLPGETLDSANYTISKLQLWGLTYTKSIIIASPKYGTDYYTIAKEQYPYIGSGWNDLNAISGLVANEMKPHILKNIVNLMYDRDFIFSNSVVQIINQ